MIDKFLINHPSLAGAVGHVFFGTVVASMLSVTMLLLRALPLLCFVSLGRSDLVDALGEYLETLRWRECLAFFLLDVGGFAAMSAWMKELVNDER